MKQFVTGNYRQLCLLLAFICLGAFSICYVYDHNSFVYEISLLITYDQQTVIIRRAL